MEFSRNTVQQHRRSEANNLARIYMSRLHCLMDVKYDLTALALLFIHLTLLGEHSFARQEGGVHLHDEPLVLKIK
jgi:hypothetical protein